jgi:hypothetical protein
MQRQRVVRSLACLSVTATVIAAFNCVPNAFPSQNSGRKADPEFCSEVAAGARRTSIAEVALGWSAAILGTGATAVGTVILPLHTPDQTIGEKMWSGGLITAGVALGALSYMFFQRSQAAGELAEQADDALADMQDPGGAGSAIDPGDAGSGWSKAKLWTTVGKCNRAIATWESTRSDPNEYAKAVAKQRKAEAQVFQSTSIGALQATYNSMCLGKNRTATADQCSALWQQIESLGGSVPTTDAGSGSAGSGSAVVGSGG